METNTVEEKKEPKQEAPEEEIEEAEEPQEPVEQELPTLLSEIDIQSVYDELNGKLFVFSSGVGAWRTGFTFTENGQFSGTFSDATGMGKIASDFEGKFTIREKIDEYTYRLNLDDLKVVSETGKEEKMGDMTITYIEDVHGFPADSHTFELYFPYKPKSEVSEKYLSWVHGQAYNDYEFLNTFGLYNVNHEYGMEELVD